MFSYNSWISNNFIDYGMHKLLTEGKAVAKHDYEKNGVALESL